MFGVQTKDEAVLLRRHAARLDACTHFAGFAGLAAHVFAAVAYAFTEIHLHRPRRADIRGNLADEPLVDARHVYSGRVFHLDRDAVRRREFHRVRIP